MGFQVTEVQKALKGIDYPAGRDDLVARAEQNGASDDLIEALRRSDEDRYKDPTAVMKAMSGSLGSG
ncbi:MAG: hypothetical protein QOH46_1772 [Solirubrobacteraceae bacterium]|jgi:hypothetical protein|nr:hypothetical protein [Solirubrobacteraceae bacterium]